MSVLNYQPATISTMEPKKRQAANKKKDFSRDADDLQGQGDLLQLIERRRLQNKLAQRRFRERTKAARKKDSEKSSGHGSDTQEQLTSSSSAFDPMPKSPNTWNYDTLPTFDLTSAMNSFFSDNGGLSSSSLPSTSYNDLESRWPNDTTTQPTSWQELDATFSLPSQSNSIPAYPLDATTGNSISAAPAVSSMQLSRPTPKREGFKKKQCHNEYEKFPLEKLLSLTDLSPLSFWGSAEQNFQLQRLSVIRAIFTNAERLGFSTELLEDCDAISYIGDSWKLWQADRRRAAQRGSLDELLPSNLALMDTASSPSSQFFNLVSRELTGQNSLTPSSTNLSETSSPQTPSTATSTSSASSGEEKEPEGKSFSKRLHWERVPPNLYPTELQLTVPHHPFFDVFFPWPAVRDRFLRLVQCGLWDEEEICKDIMDSLVGDSSATPAFTIYGDDPSLEMAWEVSEDFLHRYWTIFDDSIVKQTNYWRKQRGLPPIMRNAMKQKRNREEFQVTPGTANL